MQVYIKLTKSSIGDGPFEIKDGRGNIIDASISKNELVKGRGYDVSDGAQVIIISSIGKYKSSRNFAIGQLNPSQIASATYTSSKNACVWKHLKNPVIYNFFYNNIEPYIIEYPFAYQYNDEILQNVKDYTKAYKYLPDTDFVSMDISQRFAAFYPEFSRDTGANILSLIQNGVPGGTVARPVTSVVNNNSFRKDKLFCEWIYDINLDTKSVTVFSSFREKKWKISFKAFTVEKMRELENEEE
jgi:hypothetical protein